MVGAVDEPLVEQIDDLRLHVGLVQLERPRLVELHRRDDVPRERLGVEILLDDVRQTTVLDRRRDRRVDAVDVTGREVGGAAQVDVLESSLSDGLPTAEDEVILR